MRIKFANVAKSGNAHFVSAIYATCAGLTTGQWFAREQKMLFHSRLLIAVRRQCTNNYVPHVTFYAWLNCKNDMTTIAPRLIHHLESRDSRHTFIIGAALSNQDGAFYIELYILACAQ